MINTWSATAVRLLRGQSAPVTYGLIVACCLVFVISPVSGLNPAYGIGDQLLAAQQDYFARWGVVPSELISGAPRAALGPLTSMFVHGGWLHLIGNMLFLYVFGASSRTAWAASASPSSSSTAAISPARLRGRARRLRPDPGRRLGGDLGGARRLPLPVPRARVTSLFPFLFFLPLRFPAWVVLLFWFALQWLAARRAGAVPGWPIWPTWWASARASSTHGCDTAVRLE